MDNRRFIARRAAQYFNEGDTVNLGIGIPSACSDFVDPTIAFQTENGMIGVGPVATGQVLAVHSVWAVLWTFATVQEKLSLPWS